MFLKRLFRGVFPPLKFFALYGLLPVCAGIVVFHTLIPLCAASPVLSVRLFAPLTMLLGLTGYVSVWAVGAFRCISGRDIPLALRLCGYLVAALAGARAAMMHVMSLLSLLPLIRVPQVAMFLFVYGYCVYRVWDVLKER